MSLSDKIIFNNGEVINGIKTGAITTEDVKEFIKELKKHPYNRDRFEEQWKEHFKLLNKRKPNQSEIMCFKVGFNAGITLKEQREDKLAGEKLI